MLKTSTLRFLTDLGKNNNRDWFDANRDKYEEAKNDFELFIEQLIQKLSKTTPSLAQQKAKDCTFRIYRDVRFSKNKDPYKNNFGASIKEGGKKSPKCGFYFHLEPTNNASFLAGGFWMPEAPKLKLIRQEIEYNTDEFKLIINKKSFKNLYPEIEGDKLKNAPKGVDPNHPDIELLKFNSYIVSQPISNKEITSKDFMKTCETAYKTMKPFLDFLNRAED
jgi:uncharacterized protein (TIGR02453 family)